MKCFWLISLLLLVACAKEPRNGDVSNWTKEGLLTWQGVSWSRSNDESVMNELDKRAELKSEDALLYRKHAANLRESESAKKRMEFMYKKYGPQPKLMTDEELYKHLKQAGGKYAYDSYPTRLDIQQEAYARALVHDKKWRLVGIEENAKWAHDFYAQVRHLYPAQYRGYPNEPIKDTPAFIAAFENDILLYLAEGKDKEAAKALETSVKRGYPLFNRLRSLGKPWLVATVIEGWPEFASANAKLEENINENGAFAVSLFASIGDCQINRKGERVVTKKDYEVANDGPLEFSFMLSSKVSKGADINMLIPIEITWYGPNDNKSFSEVKKSALVARRINTELLLPAGRGKMQVKDLAMGLTPGYYKVEIDFKQPGMKRRTDNNLAWIKFLVYSKVLRAQKEKKAKVELARIKRQEFLDQIESDKRQRAFTLSERKRRNAEADRQYKITQELNQEAADASERARQKRSRKFDQFIDDATKQLETREERADRLKREEIQSTSRAQAENQALERKIAAEKRVRANKLTTDKANRLGALNTQKDKLKDDYEALRVAIHKAGRWPGKMTREQMNVLNAEFEGLKRRLKAMNKKMKNDNQPQATMYNLDHYFFNEAQKELLKRDEWQRTSFSGPVSHLDRGNTSWSDWKKITNHAGMLVQLRHRHQKDGSTDVSFSLTNNNKWPAEASMKHVGPTGGPAAWGYKVIKPGETWKPMGSWNFKSIPFGEVKAQLSIRRND